MKALTDAGALARNDVLRPAPSSITAGPGFPLASLVSRWRRCFFAAIDTKPRRYSASPGHLRAASRPPGGGPKGCAKNRVNMSRIWSGF